MAKKHVLFLCTENSARSQMAEGLLHYLAGDKFEAFSAGLRAPQVNPLAVKALAEIGINISSPASKSIKEFNGKTFDYVISVCANANKVCHTFLSTYKNLHWNLNDPAGIKGTEEERLSFFRLVREQIKDRILDFLCFYNERA